MDEGHASADEVNNMHDVDTTNVFPSRHEAHETQDDVMVDDAWDDENNMSEMLWDFEENFEDERKYNKYLSLLQDAEKPMYPDCKKKIHNVDNRARNFADEGKIWLVG